MCFFSAWFVTWRKSSWAAFLAVAFLLIAIHSAMMTWWIESPLGEFVKYLRRMALPMAMMMGVVIAYGLNWLYERHPNSRGKQLIATITALLMISSSWNLLTNPPSLDTFSPPVCKRHQRRPYARRPHRGSSGTTRKITNLQPKPFKLEKKIRVSQTHKRDFGSKHSSIDP